MDRKKSILNISASIVSKIVLIILNLISIRLLIKYIGNEANGLNSLYNSIIGVLSVAELGIGSAITFCMYKPIVENDNKKIIALYCLFEKLYRVIGMIILGAGIAIMPFLPNFAKEYTLDTNIYLAFLFVLLSTVISYCYSSKTSLINAYKNNYVTTLIHMVGNIAMYLVQIVVLWVFSSFELFLISKLISVIIQWILSKKYAKKHYCDIICKKEKLDEESSKEVKEKIKALFMHKIGYTLVNTIDNIIISTYIGVVILGKYTNYITIITAMTGILDLIFLSLGSVVGHLCAKKNVEEQKKYFKIFYEINCILAFVFFLGYYSVIDNLISIVFGENLSLSKNIVMIITINYFIKFLRHSVILFRDATGCFYHDRWKPLLEGIVNLILSFMLVGKIGVFGVILATIITNLLICNLIEPYVLYKNAFNKSPKKYYLINYVTIMAFVMCLFILDMLMINATKIYIELFINGIIAVILGAISFIMIITFDKTFKLFVLRQCGYTLTAFKNLKNKS